mmetsp:Transcript_113661/g.321384  ORF Transcript_113661/g.321384 Transcript_113661/m.321384 type:complete len:278 (+) Transcript_113661:181-1014(+)
MRRDPRHWSASRRCMKGINVDRPAGEARRRGEASAVLCPPAEVKAKPAGEARRMGEERPKGEASPAAWLRAELGAQPAGDAWPPGEVRPQGEVRLRSEVQLWGEARTEEGTPPIVARLMGDGDMGKLRNESAQRLPVRPPAPTTERQAKASTWTAGGTTGGGTTRRTTSADGGVGELALRATAVGVATADATGASGIASRPRRKGDKDAWPKRVPANVALGDADVLRPRLSKGCVGQYDTDRMMTRGEKLRACDKSNLTAKSASDFVRPMTGSVRTK